MLVFLSFGMFWFLQVVGRGKTREHHARRSWLASSARSQDLVRVRARASRTTCTRLAPRIPHTYLDGTVPFTSVCCGPWGPPIARRPCPQGEPAVCMGFGSCTVSIFSCPAPAFGLGGPFFRSAHCANPNPIPISRVAASYHRYFKHTHMAYMSL